MPRGRNQNQNHNNYRGRGGSRGRGRGGPHPGAPITPTLGTASQAPGSRHPYAHASAEIDVVIQQWPATSAVSSGANGGYYGAPWRGGTPRSRSGAGTPSRGVIQNGMSWRGGASTPRGRGRGRGFGRGWYQDDDNARGRGGGRRPHFGVGAKRGSFFGKGGAASLSDLLYSERPLLRPVKFVRATLTPFLFQDSEEVMKPAGEAVDETETSHVPTADRVAQLFHQPAISESDSEIEARTRDALEEIDFADLSQIRAEVDAIALAAAGPTLSPVRDEDAHIDQDHEEEEEELEEVDFADLAAMHAKVDAAAASRHDVLKAWNVRQTTLLSTPPARDGPRPSADVSHYYYQESRTRYRDTTIVQKEVPRSSPSPAPESAPMDSAMSLHPDIPRPLFTIDISPTRLQTEPSASDVVLVDRSGEGETLGDDEDERIVYVAPHPRTGRRVSGSPARDVPRVKLPQTSMLTGRAFDASVGVDDAGVRMSACDGDREGEGVDVEEERPPALASVTLEPTPSTPVPSQQGKPRKKTRRGRQRQKKRDTLTHGVHDTLMASEARSKAEDAREKSGPGWEMRRRGDSDLDWGTEGEDEGVVRGGGGGRLELGEGDDGDDGVDAVSDGLGAMEIDPDLEMDVDAMRGFVQSMSVEGSRFVTMDDVEDEARMQREDERGSEGGSGSECDDELEEEEAGEEGEEEDVFNLEEQILIAESDGEEGLSGDSEDDDDDDDDELSPRSSFQARLRRIRERSRGQHPKAKFDASEDDEDEDDAPDIVPGTRGAGDEAFIAHVQDLIEANSDVLAGRDRKQKKALFRELQQGDEWDVEAFLDDPEFTTPVNKKRTKKGKGKEGQFEGHFAAALEAQWDRDRAKKAAWKQARERARLLAALDSSTTGRKARKAQAQAQAQGPPRAVLDVVALEAQMRRFVGGKHHGDTRLALPPMDKGMRKAVHEMAGAFGIKSVSAGREGARYVTLHRVAGTGAGTGARVKEGKVRALVGRFQRGQGRGGGGEGGTPRQREGEEVGKEAPKIGAGNVGFKMLASMGWTEGARIGGSASAGLEAPLTAIIKHSKRGLGASTTTTRLESR